LDVNRFQLGIENPLRSSPPQYNITNISVEEDSIGDQRTLVVHHRGPETNLTAANLQKARVMAVFSEITRRVAANNDSWNVTHLKFVTKTPENTYTAYVDQRFLISVWQDDDYNLREAYEYQSGTGHTETSSAFRYTRDNVEQFQTDLEIATVDSNITEIDVYRSGATIYVTYATTTPPSDHVQRGAEMLVLTREYGQACLNHCFGHSDNLQTGLFIEEVGYDPDNGTYDIRSSLTVNQSFAEDLATGEKEGASFATHLRTFLYQGQEALGQ
jgi:hypothetical protein